MGKGVGGCWGPGGDSRPIGEALGALFNGVSGVKTQTPLSWFKPPLVPAMRSRRGFAIVGPLERVLSSQSQGASAAILPEESPLQKGSQEPGLRLECLPGEGAGRGQRQGNACGAAR